VKSQHLLPRKKKSQLNQKQHQRLQ
jgi:hypothetical protein